MLNIFCSSRLASIANTRVMTFCVTVVCLCMTTMPALAADNTNDYWVVGSYKTLASAELERERIARLTSEHVEMAAFYLDGRAAELTTGQSVAYRDGAANIRLLIRQRMERLEQREELVSNGLAVWRLSVDDQQISQFKESVAARGETLTREYWLVLGSFHGPDRARNQRDSLLKAGIDSVTLHRLEADGRYYFRVDHGPFDRIIAAQRQRFIDQGITGAFWTRVRGTALVDVE